ncbi:MAG: DUF2723 domain-containing protein [Mariniphaga sp.]
MRQFNLINNILGWTVFTIAATVYLLTIEPTASWWDCSEFIISAWKLEVGHPPGAPIHMLLGRFFSLFASNNSQVAFLVNLLSALASAGTILFLYWTIVHLARRLFPEVPTRPEQIIIWGSGLVGALAYTFTDSFWFSAVEGEVYALSSFFTAVVFWAILKWENEAGNKYAGRWLILIAYLIGLSIGVHLLSLLTIPAIALVFWFKNYPFSWKGFILTLLVSVFILGGIQILIIPGIPKLAFLFDLFFVNNLGLPFNSGVLFLLITLASFLFFLTWYTRKKKLVLWNTACTAIMVILIGYSSFGVILIRAAANPPMNQNHPDNAYALLGYLNRDQYGDHPLLYGPYYNAPMLDISGEKKYYNQIDGKYVATGSSVSQTRYHKELQTFFPRMHSNNPNHIEVYKQWGKVRGKPVKIMHDGQETTLRKPTFSENLRFFFSYQLGYMYFRYFMWNFVGKQNDKQGYGGFTNGNWISGINFLDEPRTGPRNYMPDFMKNDPSRNTYYFLPFLFGLIGLFYQYNHSKKGKEGFAVVMMLFVFTGIAIVTYLNQTPMQPRERDYAYVGSFYAFAIWIGLAVPALFASAKKLLKGIAGPVVVLFASVILVPGILAFQNFDDHNRSGRYMTRDFAINYLESCAPNAILFTYGDNDTFPLWYAQEVEGIRPDIKVINISYLGMDWYISQHRKASNKAAPVPFSFQEDQYYMGRRDAVLIENLIDGPVDLRDAIAFLGSDDERTKVEMTSGQNLNFLPSDEFFLPVNKEKVLETGTVQPEDAELIQDTLIFNINKSYLTKSEWAVLNIIAANNWERPIYINHSLLYTNYIFFTEWLQLEGLTYRFVPIQTKIEDLNAGHINTEILFNHVIQKFNWGNLNHPDVYLDDYNKRAIRIIQARQVFARLAEKLIDEGQNEKAILVLNTLFETFPDEKMPLDYDSFQAVRQYLRAGAIEKGSEKIKRMAEHSFARLHYYFSLPEYFSRAVTDEQEREMSHMQNLVVLAQRYNLTELSKEIDGKLQTLINRLSKEMDS